MPAPDTSTDKPTDGAPTTSVSTSDASTSTSTPPPSRRSDAPSSPPAETTTRVVIEQAPPEPSVYYDGEHQVAESEPVKAKYQPFEW